MRDINLNNYGQIMAQERFNLTISALARGDIKEADRLYDTCPRYDYTMADKEYNCRLMKMPIISHLFFERCVYYYNTLARIDSAILLLEAMSPPSLDEEDAARFDRLYHSRDLNTGGLKALYSGFREFCHQIGIDGEGALKTMGVEHCCVSIRQYLDSDVESPPPEEIKQIKIMFLEHWDL